jgi:hypothetical protein
VKNILIQADKVLGAISVGLGASCGSLLKAHATLSRFDSTFSPVVTLTETQTHHNMNDFQDLILAYPSQVAHAALEDGKECPCSNGWICNPFDYWQECPIHYSGQMHPEVDANIDY